MKTITLIIIIALALALLILAWIFFTLPVATPVAELPLPETPDVVKELTEGTTITDIERDLETLEKEALLGDVDTELQQAEQELQSEGL